MWEGLGSRFFKIVLQHFPWQERKCVFQSWVMSPELEQERNNLISHLIAFVIYVNYSYISLMSMSIAGDFQVCIQRILISIYHVITRAFPILIFFFSLIVNKVHDHFMVLEPPKFNTQWPLENLFGVLKKNGFFHLNPYIKITIIKGTFFCFLFLI